MDYREAVAWSLGRTLTIINNAAADLTEEEAGYRPCATCNSIASTIIHCGRAVDTWTTSALGEDDDIWITQGWAKKFGLPDDDRGWTYDTQPPAERAPVAELPAYFEATNRRFLDLVANVPGERLTEPVQGRRFSLPLEKLFSHIVTELAQHAGQIDYVRGMLGKDSAITGTPPPKPMGNGRRRNLAGRRTQVSCVTQKL